MENERAFDDIRMCIDRFVPEDRASAAEADAINIRPDNLRVVPLGIGRGLGRPRMAIATETLWRPGTVINVRFVDGIAEVQQKVEDIAHGWEEFANVRFEFGDAPDAPVRISFAQEGSWSNLGTVALQIPDPEATMNFGWLTPDSEDEEFSRVVLHEFEHALGAIHEHQSPDVRIPWD